MQACWNGGLSSWHGIVQLQIADLHWATCTWILNILDKFNESIAIVIVIAIALFLFYYHCKNLSDLEKQN